MEHDRLSYELSTVWINEYTQIAILMKSREAAHDLSPLIIVATARTASAKATIAERIARRCAVNIKYWSSFIHNA